MHESFFSKTGIYYRINDLQTNRKNLVFIHGLTGSASVWFEYENRLDNLYNILTMDLRGHGQSMRYKNYADYEIKNFGQDIYEILNYLRLQQITLISHSFGTLVALEFLLQHQSMAESVLFLSSYFDADKTSLVQITKPLVKWSVEIADIFPFSKKAGRHIDYSQFPNVDDWDFKLNLAEIRNTGSRVHLFCLGQIYETNYSRRWNSVVIPTLVVHGKDDTVIPVQNAIALSQQIPQSKLVILDNANHMFVLNNISETVNIIKHFIN